MQQVRKKSELENNKYLNKNCGENWNMSYTNNV